MRFAPQMRGSLATLTLALLILLGLVSFAAADRLPARRAARPGGWFSRAGRRAASIATASTAARPAAP